LQPSKDPHGDRWNSLPEQGRGAIIIIAGVKRSPKLDWQGLGPARDRLRSHLDALADRPSSVDAKAHEAATSPHSDERAPSAAQTEAGNHKKGHFSISGVSIAVSHPEGSIRHGENAAGVRWFTKVRSAHYGHALGTKGADGEQVDVFVRPGTPDDLPDTAPVFVIEQINPKTRKFDEWKAMVGYATGGEARKAYADNFPRSWKGFGRITRMSLAEFKTWLASDKPSKPGSVR
jgi:hypothetical protein